MTKTWIHNFFQLILKLSIYILLVLTVSQFVYNVSHNKYDWFIGFGEVEKEPVQKVKPPSNAEDFEADVETEDEIIVEVNITYLYTYNKS